MKTIAIAGMIIFGLVSNCFAGAWTLPEGKMYNKVAVNSYSATREYDRNGNAGEMPRGGEFNDLNLSEYVEFGYSDTVTLIGSTSYKWIEKKDWLQTTKTDGVGDIELGVKYKLAETPSGIFSGQFMLKVPGTYDKNGALPLGNGQTDAEVRGLYGASLWRYFPGYCNFEVAYRLRSEAPADEVRYLAEFGVDLSPKIYGRVKLDGILSMKNSDRSPTGGANPTYINEYDEGKLDMALGYKISDVWGVEAGYTPSIYGKNIAKGATYTVGITYLTH